MTPAQLATTGELAAGLESPGPSKLPPGLYADVEDAWYHRKELGLASKSALDQVHHSGARYLSWLHGEDKETPAMVTGRAVHVAVLQPHVWASYACSTKDAALGNEIAQAVRRHSRAGAILRRGRAEMMARWDDVTAGVPCKARFDWYDEELGLVLDLKTTTDASAREFARSVANFRYHVQAAMYLDALRALGRPADHFVFLAVEKAPPFDMALYELDEDAIAAGRRAMRADMAKLVECSVRGEFPGYPEMIQTLSLPAWAI